MSERKHILVVDDDLQSRKIFYSRALGENYELSFTENADTIFFDLNRIKPDLYIIDLNLEGYNNPKSNTPLNASEVLGEIGVMKPVIFLSGSYKQLMEDDRLTPMISFAAEKGFNICSFFSWDEIVQAAKKENTSSRETIFTKIDFAIKKNRKPYDFGIVCALNEELDPFMKKIDKMSVSYGAVNGVKYKSAILNTKSERELRFVASVSTNMGMTDAAVVTTSLVEKLGVKTVFMIGVCGGRESEGIEIGDVIIPKESIAYQRGKLGKNGFSSDTQEAKPKESGFINYDGAKDIIQTLFHEYVSKLLKEENRTMALSQPKIVYDAIACADYVVDKEGELDAIAEKIGRRKLCGVDMESYAIYRVGEICDVRTLVIKSVMDLTNNKSDKYKEYAAFLAANYLYQLLYNEVITFEE